MSRMIPKEYLDYDLASSVIEVEDRGDYRLVTVELRHIPPMPSGIYEGAARARALVAIGMFPTIWEAVTNLPEDKFERITSVESSRKVRQIRWRVVRRIKVKVKVDG